MFVESSNMFRIIRISLIFVGLKCSLMCVPSRGQERDVLEDVSRFVDCCYYYHHSLGVKFTSLILNIIQEYQMFSVVTSKTCRTRLQGNEMIMNKTCRTGLQGNKMTTNKTCRTRLQMDKMNTRKQTSCTTGIASLLDWFPYQSSSGNQNMPHGDNTQPYPPLAPLMTLNRTLSVSLIPWCCFFSCVLTWWTPMSTLWCNMLCM